MFTYFTFHSAGQSETVGTLEEAVSRGWAIVWARFGHELRPVLIRAIMQ